ncbi:MAG: ATP-binding protein [Methylomonas sp.]|nr:ATP-binding protein [Methylomonas sp.]
MPTAIDDFDRELTLQELLRGIDVNKLSSALQALLHAPVAVIDNKETHLFGSENCSTSAPRVALIAELEAIGYLTADADSASLQAARDILMLLLRSNARYLIASDLHLKTQLDDFEELQRRHAALEVSEQRYKALAQTLEQRVGEQVKTIEKARIKVFASEKLASVGRLAAGIAHEINNPIGFIHSNLNAISSYLESLDKIGTLVESGAGSADIRATWQREDMTFLQQDLKDILAECIAGTTRIAAIIRDLKGYSRVDQADYQSANVNDILRQVSNIAKAEVGNKARILLDLGEIPNLNCQAGLLGQVFLGLLLNAADAIAENGKILLRTRLDDKRICIDVRDNGHGIPEEALQHIFDPFFTTKEVGTGMGLGLTVCLDIVKSHGGQLEIKSKPGKGTLVSIALPLQYGKPS